MLVLVVAVQDDVGAGAGRRCRCRDGSVQAGWWRRTCGIQCILSVQVQDSAIMQAHAFGVVLFVQMPAGVGSKKPLFVRSRVSAGNLAVAFAQLNKPYNHCPLRRR